MMLRLVVACLVFVPFMGIRLGDDGGLTWHWGAAALCVAGAVVAGLINFTSPRWERSTGALAGRVRGRLGRIIPSPSHSLRNGVLPLPSGRGLLILTLIALIIPLFAGRQTVDLLTLILVYATLAAALNIVVGYTGLLDLGFIAFFAIGAYAYALLSQGFGMGFWTCLPLAAIIPALISMLLGCAVLRLRGDYFAIVTLGFLQIVDTLLVNWQGLTHGSQGITGIARPTLFGLEFSSESTHSFAAAMGMPFDPVQRIVFLYYIALAMTLAANALSLGLRRTPLGRAWEALREDEVAAASIGIARAPAKLAAYAISAAMAGVAGEFFAARQGFISPESFGFLDSAIVLAIVVLGGAGSPLGILAAAFFLIGTPEIFRGFADYRMLVFGACMVIVMQVRPRGLAALRRPTVRLASP
jgi:branched-chain amino acid transport system permease protein